MNTKSRMITGLSFAVGELGEALPMASLSFFLLYFYTDVVKISPSLAGLAILMPHIWNAIADPIIGVISDQTHSKWGRRRPYLLFGAPFYAIFFVLLWCPPISLSENTIFLYLLVFAFLTFTMSTIVLVPYNSLLPGISDDPIERTKIMGYRQPFTVIGWMVGGTLMLPIAKLFATEQKGFFLTALIFGGVTLLAILITFFGVREKTHREQLKRIPLKISLQHLIKNKPFWIFVTAFSFASLGFTFFTNSAVYYAKYWLGDEDLISYLIGIVMLCVVLSVPLWVFLSGKIGKKESFILGVVIQILSTFALFLCPRSAGILIYLLMVTSGIGLSAYFIFSYAILPEIIDFCELRSGARNEGMYFGTFFLIFKIAVSITPFSTGLILKYTGYVPNTIQTDSVLFGIRLLAAGIPSICFIVAFFILLFFPFSRARTEQICDRLKLKNTVSFK